MTPACHQSVSREDIEKVVQVLLSNNLTQGEEIPKFESAISSYTNSNYCVAVNSGTSALHLACLALGLSQDSELWTSPISFVASANCGLYCGAHVDFVDIDPDTANISVEALERKLREEGPPDILVAVHFTGSPCDMVKIYGLAQQYGFKIIEDACHALGAEYRGAKVGSCYYSDMTVFSFHPVKTITTGEGGAITTNNNEWAERLRLLRSHGITREDQQNPWEYQQLGLGHNYRMTDFQAALGRTQLIKVDEFVNYRNYLVHAYREALIHEPLQFIQGFPKYSKSAAHLCIICVEQEKRTNVFNYLRSKNVGVNVHYMPIYWHPYYQALGFQKGLCPNAEHYYNRCLTLPVTPKLSLGDQDYIIKCVKESLQNDHSNYSGKGI